MTAADFQADVARSSAAGRAWLSNSSHAAQVFVRFEPWLLLLDALENELLFHRIAGDAQCLRQSLVPVLPVQP